MEDTTFGFLRKSTKIKKMIEVLKEIEPSIDPKQKVKRLSVAKKQIVEIAKAVASESNIIIMDEPTASISESEIKRLFKIIKELKKNNVTVIYISHRLDEIFEIGDYVTVMRDGKHIATKPVVAEMKDRSELIRMMIGKSIVESYIPRKIQEEDILLQVRNLSNEKLKNIEFDIKKGEVVGFYGLVGAGKTELARAVFGADKYSGEIIFKGRQLGSTPAKAIEAGIALVPEERRTQGIFTILTIRSNIPVMNMKKISNGGFVDAAKEKQVAIEYIDKLKIVTSGPEKETAKLSGGNQQKRYLQNSCLPTVTCWLMSPRGIDVEQE